MEERKQKEIEFHNFLRNLPAGSDEHKHHTTNTKFYSITRKSVAYVENWLKNRCRNGTMALEYGCGEGSYSLFLAKLGAQVTGIDISDVGIRISREAAQKEGLSANTKFVVMDAEEMTFSDNTFDVLSVSGVLHHLDRTRAFKEMARVLKPTGAAIAAEPLAHNPLIQWYRTRTPHLRTEFEAHNLLHAKKDIELAKQHFNNVDVKFFHLATLFAVPFRNTKLFNRVLTLMEWIDNILLKIPFIQRQAWQMVVMFSNPKKS